MENQMFIEKNDKSRKSKGIQNPNEEDEIFIDKNLLPLRKSKLKDYQVKFIKNKSFNERKKYKKKSSNNIISNEGRWSKEEHEKFLEGIELYGTNWHKVKTLIETRTSVQVRSHAQKFFYKMKACKDENLGIDFTSNTVCNVKDMINQIKNHNYNIINVFKYLADKYDNIEKSRNKIEERINNNIAFKRSEQNNQSNIINLKEDNSNINDNNFFFNQSNNINKGERMKEALNINDNKPNDITKMTNQNNIFNILQDLLTINYNSNAFNSLLPYNYFFSINNIITNKVNELLINYFISNKSVNDLNIINENILLSLALQNDILSNININNYLHNFNNNINFEDINLFTKNNNYNNFRNFRNGNTIDKFGDYDENGLFNNIGKKVNINLRDNNNNDYNDNIGNKDNKNNGDININSNDYIFCSDKHWNKINDKKKNNNENSNNNYIFN